MDLYHQFLVFSFLYIKCLSIFNSEYNKYLKNFEKKDMHEESDKNFLKLILTF